ncbi:transcriptional repressor [Treponema sp.]
MNAVTEVKRYKRSRQRERILSLLQSTKTHPTAAWVYDSLKKELPGLSLGTVYRNLGILSDQGLVRVLQAGSTFDRFDADVSQHYHCICENCGKVEDVLVPVSPDLEAQAERQLGHPVTGHRLDFYGLCSECSAQNA